MEILKEGNSYYLTTEMIVTCPVCGCVQKGTINDGDFVLYMEHPYHFKYTCAYCGKEIKS